MSDSAEYWATKDGTVMHLKFLAKLDLSGQFSKIGAYFNLGDSEIEIPALKKVKAQFELCPLDEEDMMYPPEAIECSQFTHNAIITFCSEVEATRNKGIPPSKLPNVIPFYQMLQCENHYCLVVHTEPLFRDLPNPQASTVTPGMTLASLSEESTLMSPSKAKAAAAIQVKCTPAKPVAKRVPVWSIFDMPDPAYRYKSLYDVCDLTEVKVMAPNVCDRNGTLIHAGKYEQKLQDGDVVKMDVIMKLWTIQVSGSGANSKDSNRSHIYQLVLHKMKLMPYDSYLKELFKDDGKGKRKAKDEPIGHSLTKKGGSGATLSNSMDLDDVEVL
ncbi:hypothetical protein J3R83DRAFT_4003 [Lanmaoa asiatica]|nr:hypothetical protein J3R83DRAFT_4003 [Lanmaoa asiatica]